MDTVLIGEASEGPLTPSTAWSPRPELGHCELGSRTSFDTTSAGALILNLVPPELCKQVINKATAPIGFLLKQLEPSSATSKILILKWMTNNPVDYMNPSHRGDLCLPVLASSPHTTRRSVQPKGPFLTLCRPLCLCHAFPLLVVLLCLSLGIVSTSVPEA